MPLFALDPWWNDALAISGFVIGLVGTLLGAVGLWYTYHQVRKVETAATAANAATEKAHRESEELYSRFIGAYASRLLVDLQRAVLGENWAAADSRAQELADLLAALPDAADPGGGDVSKLRGFGLKFAAGGKGYGKAKWDEFAQRLHARLDALRTLRLGGAHGPNRSDDPRPAVPGDRPESSRSDAGGAGELDADRPP